MNQLLLRSALAVVLLPALGSPLLRAEEFEAPENPGEVIEWVGERWKASGWGANDAPRYLRPMDGVAWKARMSGLQAIAKAGKTAVPPLLAALKDDDREEVRIFAAQALGFVASESSKKVLLEALKDDPSPAVRLYAADSLGMIGAGLELKSELTEIRREEKNRDVKKHLGYTLGREATRVDSAVVEELAQWDPAKMDTAKVGEAAPDFELEALNGEKVRLGEYRGKSPVVLVFIYGDT